MDQEDSRVGWEFGPWPGTALPSSCFLDDWFLNLSRMGRPLVVGNNGNFHPSGVPVMAILDYEIGAFQHPSRTDRTAPIRAGPAWGLHLRGLAIREF